MVGEVFGKYRLIAELGHGGMADVFLAVTDGGAGFAKLIVIKMPSETVSQDPEFLTMLMDEARIAARLNHPNVVQTLEVGKVDKHHFLAMEFLDGQPLHRILSRARDKVPLEMHCTILSEVLEGVHYAHELADYDGKALKIVHRDVTPHNVFVTYDGQAKVLDFGIAKSEGRTSETRYGVIKGKLAYMAPEQVRGAVDHRVDVFTVGIMLFEAATRDRLWKGVAEDDIMRQLVRGTYARSPKARVPDIPEHLDRICQRALSFKPDDRYATAREMQEDLDAFLVEHGSRQAPRAVGAYLSGLFADRRAETRKVIEQQLAGLKQKVNVPILKMTRPPAAGDAPVASRAADDVPAEGHERSFAAKLSRRDVPTKPANAASSSSEAQKKGLDLLLSEPSSSTSEREKSTSRTKVSRGSSSGLPRGLVIGALLAAALAVGAFAVVARTRDAGSPVTSSPPPATTVTGAQTTVVTLKAMPLEARFSIDDGPLEKNPFLATLPRDNLEHRIRAEAPGFEARTEVVTFDQSSVSLRFSLEEGGRK